MLTLAELKKRPDLISQVDWELTPRQAFMAYQLKSVDAWRYRSLPETLYFLLSTWRGENQIYLVRRSLKHSQEVARIEPPPDLLTKALAAQDGEEMPRGQLPLDKGLKAWLRAELGF